MPTINKLISSWRKWLNRNQTFQKKELDELEDHLIEEIDYLVKRENLSEEEAFQKAMMDVGKREVLDKDFQKARGFSLLWIKNWYKQYAFPLFVCSLLIISLFVTDLIFTSTHFITETINKTAIVSVLKPIVENSFSEEDGNTIKISWGSKEFPMKTKPVLGCYIYLVDVKLNVILDDQDQLWFDKDLLFKGSRFNKSINHDKNDTIGPFQLKSYICLTNKIINPMEEDVDPLRIKVYFADIITLANNQKILSLYTWDQKQTQLHLLSRKHFQPGKYEPSIFDGYYEFIKKPNPQTKFIPWVTFQP
jgi:hypothetical protein